MTPPSADERNESASERVSLMDDLRRLVREHPRPTLTIADMVEHLGDRAFGVLMLAMALPMATPLSAIPGVSTVFGVPLILVCLQLAIGLRRPRLPDALARRGIDRAQFWRALERADKWLSKIERYVHPRLPILTSAIAERLIGIVAAGLAVLMALPIPGANQPPAIAISLFAFAIAERDGMFAIFGLIAGVLSLALLAAIYGLIAAGGIFIFQHATG